MIDVVVQIPSGYTCRADKRCIFSRYNQQHNCYSCSLFNRFLKGSKEEPRKCMECIQEFVEHHED